MERNLIVWESDQLVLHKRSKLWLTGWIFGLAMAILCAFALGYGVAYHRAMDEVAKARQNVNEVAHEQLLASTNLAQAWGEQREAIKVIVGWSEYIKARDEMIAENKTGQPVVWKVKTR